MPPKKGTRASTRTAKPAPTEKTTTTTKKTTTAATKAGSIKAATATKQTRTVKAAGSAKQTSAKKAPSTTARKTKTATTTTSSGSRKRKAEAVEAEAEPVVAKPAHEPKKPRVVKAARAPPAPKPKVVINHAPTTKLDVYVCGEGSSGELGLGTTKNAIDVKRPRLNPLLAADKVGVVQVAVGGMHCVALTHDNKILTWGVNDQGALGRDTAWEGGYKDIDENKSDSDSDSEDDPALNPREAVPTEIPADAFSSGTVFVEVAAGDSSSFALTDEGLVYGWGTFRVS